MIWVTWRQFRTPALVMLAGCAAYALALGWLGYSTRHAYDKEILGCSLADGCRLTDQKRAFLSEFTPTVSAAQAVLLLLPALIGAFWGAPLLGREFEAGTQRLAWTQSVTRRRWLAAKLLLPGLATVLLTAALSFLLTWAADRFDEVEGTRFTALSFASRDVVPVGYALFAFAAGTAAGLFLRRTLPAMAATLAVVAAVLFLWPSLVRPHLRPPVTESVAFDQSVRDHDANVSFGHDRPAFVAGYQVPGALMLSKVTYLRTSSGALVQPSTVQDCLAKPPAPMPGTDGAGTVDQCMTSKHLHFDVTMQPADRYWSFQWIELGAYTLLAALLATLAYHHITQARA
ncbi:ABC transporter permease subunit [Actinomadura sp. NPDC048394]|uniref:ABC transporter permease subunit n=1 Tax=Actinomadura sp. NPDC048394 TaxID=3158223 RepID=UPI0033E8EC05